MGLLSNLRVLCGSDIGDVVRDLRKKVIQLAGDVDEVRELSEARYRRVRKRQRDAQDDEPEVTEGVGDPRLLRLRQRRAGRANGDQG